MEKWNAEQQIKTLKYGAYTTLWAAAMFAAVLTNNIAESLALSYQGLVSSAVIITALGFVIYSIRWTSKYKIFTHGWREMLGLYSDEFARDTNHKANTLTLYVVLLVLVAGFLLGDIVARDDGLSQWFNMANYSLALLIIGALLWSGTVLYLLRGGEDG
ncbi:hypothetical protein [Rheinheimera nanhaiensis]|uniref:Uncharacterized protein n=1 Tax=Rheinheimera nanhaiensis E407-8 TaxID=562729 RepID=I1DZW0_9GAMM|nr:hypothetical protein [Rheinheimera nanhaiensis]GAB59588.1 hypothetical protein RNAN_2594 [Rheinheimera nanhaiensis E407-8]